MFRKLKISVQQKSVKKGKSTENILVKNALEGYLLKNAKKAAKPAAQQAFVAARAAYRAAKLAFESARSSTRAPGRFSFANLVRKNGRMNTTTTAVRSKSSTRRRDAFMMKSTRVIPKNKKQWRSTLETHICPSIGDIPIDEINDIDTSFKTSVKKLLSPRGTNYNRHLVIIKKQG